MENTRQTGSRYGCSIACFGPETSATTATAGVEMTREVVDVVSWATRMRLDGGSCTLTYNMSRTQPQRFFVR
jgi:hypothetical protein